MPKGGPRCRASRASVRAALWRPSGVPGTRDHETTCQETPPHSFPHAIRKLCFPYIIRLQDFSNRGDAPAGKKRFVCESFASNLLLQLLQKHLFMRIGETMEGYGKWGGWITPQGVLLCFVAAISAQPGHSTFFIEQTKCLHSTF